MSVAGLEVWDPTGVGSATGRDASEDADVTRIVQYSDRVIMKMFQLQRSNQSLSLSRMSSAMESSPGPISLKASRTSTMTSWRRFHFGLPLLTPVVLKVRKTSTAADGASPVKRVAASFTSGSGLSSGFSTPGTRAEPEARTANDAHLLFNLQSSINNLRSLDVAICNDAEDLDPVVHNASQVVRKDEFSDTNHATGLGHVDQADGGFVVSKVLHHNVNQRRSTGQIETHERFGSSGIFCAPQSS